MTLSAQLWPDFARAATELFAENNIELFDSHEVGVHVALWNFIRESQFSNQRIHILTPEKSKRADQAGALDARARCTRLCCHGSSEICGVASVST
jgi:hypothetical protein